MRCAIALCLGVVLAGGFGWAQESGKGGDKKAAKQYDAKAGAATYKQKCALCHGAEGAGDTQVRKKLKLRDLGSAEVQKQTDAQLFEITANGKGQMPPYLKQLGHDKIHEVVAFIRTLKK